MHAQQLNQLKQQGRSAFDQRDYQRALEIFDQILALRPQFADIRNAAALCHVFLGRPEEALVEFEEALAVNPGYVEAHVNRALVLQDLGRYDEAREAFEHASENERRTHARFPAAATARLANAHAAVGDLYLEAGAHEEAAEQYRIALELRPRFHDIRNKYALARIELGDLDTAITELESILDWNPAFLAARLNLGLALYRQGRTADAAAEWTRCREQAPAHPQVRAYAAMLESTWRTADSG
jgi:tetratricopeptide (TPR) repeat protein